MVNERMAKNYDTASTSGSKQEEKPTEPNEDNEVDSQPTGPNEDKKVDAQPKRDKGKMPMTEDYPEKRHPIHDRPMPFRFYEVGNRLSYRSKRVVP